MIQAAGSEISDARTGGQSVPFRPRSRLMNAYSGTKFATARNRLRSLSADGVQWVLQEPIALPPWLITTSDRMQVKLHYLRLRFACIGN